LIQDEVGEEGVSLMVVLAGYPILRSIREERITGISQEPIRRYFEMSYSFRGICGVEDLRYFLESFDTTVYPEDSNWQFTRFYFPQAYERGWRLWHEAQTAWSIFQQMACVEVDELEIEMPYIQTAIFNLLEAAYAHGSGALPPDIEAWKAAVLHSGFIESQTLKTNVPDRKERSPYV
jgi:hypothetical protein